MNKCLFSLLVSVVVIIVSCRLDKTIAVTSDVYLYNPESSGIWSLIQKKGDSLYKGLLEANILEIKGNDDYFFIKQYANRSYNFYFLEVDETSENHVFTGISEDAFNSFNGKTSYHYIIHGNNVLPR